MNYKGWKIVLFEKDGLWTATLLGPNGERYDALPGNTDRAMLIAAAERYINSLSDEDEDDEGKDVEYKPSVPGM